MEAVILIQDLLSAAAEVFGVNHILMFVLYICNCKFNRFYEETMISLLLSLTQAFGWKNIKEHAHNLRIGMQARVGKLDRNTKETRAEYAQLAKEVMANLRQATNEAKQAQRIRDKAQRDAKLKAIQETLNKDIQETVAELETIDRLLPQEEDSPQDSRVLNSLKKNVASLKGRLEKELGLVTREEK